MDNESFGIAMGQRKRANAVENAGLGLAIALQQARDSIAALEMKLAIANAEAAARFSQVKAMEAQHPSSPQLVNTNDVFKGEGHAGVPKTKLRLIYEARFDELLANLNIADPAKHRLD